MSIVVADVYLSAREGAERIGITDLSTIDWLTCHLDQDLNFLIFLQRV